MSRLFEKSYGLLFGRSPIKFTILFLIIIIISSIIKFTLLYFIEFILLYIFFIILEKRIVNWRRALYLTSTSIVISALLELALSSTPLEYSVVAAAFSATVAMALKCNSRLYAMPLLFASAYYLSAGDLAMSIASLSYLLSMPLLRRAIEKLIDGVDGMCLFNGFLYASFANHNLLEDLLRQFGERGVAMFHVFLLKGDEKYAFVISDLHPGPFKNIGGGGLVDVLDEACRRAGYKFAFLHGVGGPETDPIDKRAIVRVVNALVKVAEEIEMGELRGIRPKTAIVGDVKATAFSLGAAPYLAIISRVNSASDDIPTSVANAVNSEFVIVDAQNKYHGEIRWNKEDVESLKRALEELEDSRTCDDIQIGVGKASAASIDPVGLEIGPVGITAVVAKCDGRKSLLIILDGNNIENSLYRKIISNYDDYEVVEVVTTDTHRSVGMGLGRGYRTIGERLGHEEILKLIESAVNEAVGKIGKWKSGYKRAVFEVEVLGERGFEKLKKAVGAYKRVALFILFYDLLLPAILATAF